MWDDKRFRHHYALLENSEIIRPSGMIGLPQRFGQTRAI
jgi:hypothetical protein